ncbi:UNVERIFIED_CONTAM: hypothetical protein HDU68_011755 [Siphonaria sp. JEL0065]|nr:hypothetical protein HDU68_011755 [Siphonaria sp. JEL0065]
MDSSSTRLESSFPSLIKCDKTTQQEQGSSLSALLAPHESVIHDFIQSDVEPNFGDLGDNQQNCLKHHLLVAQSNPSQPTPFSSIETISRMPSVSKLSDRDTIRSRPLCQGLDTIKNENVKVDQTPFPSMPRLNQPMDQSIENDYDALGQASEVEAPTITQQKRRGRSFDEDTLGALEMLRKDKEEDDAGGQEVSEVGISPTDESSIINTDHQEEPEMYAEETAFWVGDYTESLCPHDSASQVAYRKEKTERIAALQEKKMLRRKQWASLMGLDRSMRSSPRRSSFKDGSGQAGEGQGMKQRSVSMGNLLRFSKNHVTRETPETTQFMSFKNGSSSGILGRLKNSGQLVEISLSLIQEQNETIRDSTLNERELPEPESSHEKGNWMVRLGRSNSSKTLKKPQNPFVETRSFTSLGCRPAAFSTQPRPVTTQNSSGNTSMPRTSSSATLYESTFPPSPKKTPIHRFFEKTLGHFKKRALNRGVVASTAHSTPMPITMAICCVDQKSSKKDVEGCKIVNADVGPDLRVSPTVVDKKPEEKETVISTAVVCEVQEKIYAREAHLDKTAEKTDYALKEIIVQDIRSDNQVLESEEDVMVRVNDVDLQVSAGLARTYQDLLMW